MTGDPPCRLDHAHTAHCPGAIEAPACGALHVHDDRCTGQLYYLPTSRLVPVNQAMDPVTRGWVAVIILAAAVCLLLLCLATWAALAGTVQP